MNKKSLYKVKEELLAMRRSPQGRKPHDLEAIAKQLGRKRDTTKGKEPTYVREKDPELSPPLSIPAHGSKELKTGTARNIIDALLDDVSDWEIYLEELEDDNENEID
ncbi:type II toxin-antitoxin system HicA family toxin [Methylococcaceae bacterium WWC4]|nr:type II toxin-antitoxin system HicA family toxin [Methylococcaceae bacterium WWC4]